MGWARLYYLGAFTFSSLGTDGSLRVDGNCFIKEFWRERRCGLFR